jgi:hypothetical protein
VRTVRITFNGKSDSRIDAAVEMIEAALLGTEGRRAIWDDRDYLVAALALLTGDGMRAREMALRPPTRRVSLGLSDGGVMSVSLPGRRPLTEEMLESLRDVGEAAMRRLEEEPAR